MSLFERFRPATFADVVGQDKAVARLQAIGKRGWGGRAYWLSGLPGTGKTSIARVLASELAGPQAIREQNAADWGVDDVREMREWLYGRTIPLGPNGLTGRAVILNEGHSLRAPVIRQLLTTLEELKPHAAVIFTATAKGTSSLFGADDADGDTGALRSRCLTVQLETADYILKQAFARRVREIAVGEGLDGQPHEWYVALADRCKWNMRAMLQAVESGE